MYDNDNVIVKHSDQRTRDMDFSYKDMPTEDLNCWVTMRKPKDVSKERTTEESNGRLRNQENANRKKTLL